MNQLFSHPGAMHHARDDRGALPAVAAVHVKSAIVRSACAFRPAAAAPVDGNLPLARLIDEVGRVARTSSPMATPYALPKAASPS